MYQHINLKSEVRYKTKESTKHEIQNTKQIQNSNVQLFKTDSNAVVLSERPANEESPN